MANAKSSISPNRPPLPAFDAYASARLRIRRILSRTEGAASEDTQPENCPFVMFSLAAEYVSLAQQRNASGQANDPEMMNEVFTLAYVRFTEWRKKLVALCDPHDLTDKATALVDALHKDSRMWFTCGRS